MLMQARWLRPLPALCLLLTVAACAQEADQAPYARGPGGSLVYATSFPITFDGGALASGTAATGLWHVSANRSFSPPYALWYGQDTTGDYDTGGPNSGEYRLLADIGARTTLAFEYWMDTECTALPCSFDFLTVEISTDGGSTWAIEAGPQVSTAGAFQPVTVDVTPYQNQSVQVRFLFDTIDGAVNNTEGVYLDSIDLF